MASNKVAKAASKRAATAPTKRFAQSVVPSDADNNEQSKHTDRVLGPMSLRGRTRTQRAAASAASMAERSALSRNSRAGKIGPSEESASPPHVSAVSTVANASNVTPLRPGMATITVEVEVEQGQERVMTEFIHRLLPIASLVQHEKTDAQLKKLSEALLPDIVPHRYQIIEAAMQSEAKAAVLNSGDFITAAQLCELARFSPVNPSAQPNRWKTAGQTFAIKSGRQDYYPLYGFDLEPTLRPKPALKQIIKTLQMDDWHLAFWFMSGCGMLDGRRPQDVLGSDPEGVLAAAIDEAMGITHG